MKLIAHRGYKSKNIKENTIEAFDNALANGFIGFECDIRYTKDKKIVVCHDPFIDRVSDGHGLIKNMTYKNLLKYNFGTNRYPSKIVLLKDVLKRYYDKCIKVIEIKVYVDLKNVVKYIDDKTYFISFNDKIIDKVKREYPLLKCGLLNAVYNSKKNYNYDIVCILDSLMDDKIDNYFKNRNIDVFIYGIFKKIDFYNKTNFYICDNKTFKYKKNKI